MKNRKPNVLNGSPVRERGMPKSKAAPATKSVTAAPATNPVFSYVYDWQSNKHGRRRKLKFAPCWITHYEYDRKGRVISERAEPFALKDAKAVSKPSSKPRRRSKRGLAKRSGLG